ncbi:host ATPase affecting protein [Alishewanella phage vB_AspM_Slickus01]|nr:host ATPase affecting protein [Alishewanella phage vB_AspM_Slickus01]
MQNNLSEQLKADVAEYVKNLANSDGVEVNAVNKTAVAKKFGISPRSVGRIIERMQNLTVDTKPTEISTKSLETVAVVGNECSVINWTITQKSILLTLSDGNNASITSSNANYTAVVNKLLAGDFDVLELVNPEKSFSYKFGHIEIDDECIYFDGHAVDKNVGMFVIEAVRAGDISTVERLTKFLNNLLQNPSFRATQTLYAFIKHNDITITDDGMMLAWKRITGDYKDVYTKTIDNSVGTTVKIMRNNVEEDPNKTCAKGLHLCAKSYLSSYSGDRVVQCLLNPKDVVAVPIDYNGAKLRCSEYKVLADVTESFEAGKL